MHARLERLIVGTEKKVILSRAKHREAFGEASLQETFDQNALKVLSYWRRVEASWQRALC